MNTSSINYEPKVVVDTSNLTEEAWLEYRRYGIGGSDAAAVLGISPYATARDLYYDKVKVAPLDDSDETESWVAKKIGHLLEDLVAEIFSRRTGYRIYQIKKMFRHPEHIFMIADIDYFIELPTGETAILEIKTTNYNARDNWWRDGKEVVPANYEVQGRHYMCVMNVRHIYYCCLYGNSEDEVIIRHIERDFEYESELIALESEFWNEYVLNMTPPPYTEDGDMIIESVKRHYGAADPSAPTVQLSKSNSSGIARYLELQTQKRAIDAQAKSIEGEMKRLQGQIVDEMGNSCNAVCSSGSDSYIVTYNPVKRLGVSKENLVRLQAQHPDIYDEYVTATESRRFSIKMSQDTAA